MRLNENTYPAYATLEKGELAWLKIDAMFDLVISTPEDFNNLVGEVANMFSQATNRFYLTVPFKDAIIQSAPKFKDSLLEMDEKHSGIFFTDKGFSIFRYDPTNDNIFTAFGFTREILTTYGVLNKKGEFSGVACSTKEGKPHNDKEGLRNWMLTMLLAINFIKFCDIEQKIIKPNEKYRKDGVKYFNESKTDFKILDCGWFTELIRDTPFTVRGHLRWQVYGEGRKGRKLIWIEEFQKEGYHKNPKKENV